MCRVKNILLTKSANKRKSVVLNRFKSSSPRQVGSRCTARPERHPVKEGKSDEQFLAKDQAAYQQVSCVRHGSHLMHFRVLAACGLHEFCANCVRSRESSRLSRECDKARVPDDVLV